MPLAQYAELFPRVVEGQLYRGEQRLAFDRALQVIHRARSELITPDVDPRVEREKGHHSQEGQGKAAPDCHRLSLNVICHAAPVVDFLKRPGITGAYQNGTDFLT